MASIQWRIEDFPLGVANLLGGATTSDSGDFCRNVCENERTGGPIGEGVGERWRRPLDPPMQFIIFSPLVLTTSIH